jgi:parallel beta-helix repeat protein
MTARGPHRPTSSARARGATRSPEERRHLRRAAVAWVVVAALVVGIAYGTVAFIVSQAEGGPTAVAPPPVEDFAPGAAAVGTTAYPVPETALFVSKEGADEAAGTEAAPLRTVQQAVTVATPGQTIVVREGSYHQRVTVTADKPVTIQPYPDEEVWFDGSVVLTEWVPDGGMWIAEGWATGFDSSPTYARGAPDNTEEGWNFINPEFPLAAHPDQVWVDGEQLRQVATSDDVVDGAFAVDAGSSRLFLGTDPSNREVRASDKTKAFAIQSENTVLRGIGVRRYATSVPGFGAITVEAAGVTIENVVIEQSATTGLFVAAGNATITGVTLRANGMMGMGANFADGMRVRGLLSSGNNTEHFNNSPVSGGVKITRSRELVIEKSQFSDNFGPGLWFDQSNADVKVVGNAISANQGHGLFLEISSSFAVAGNTISDNLDNGVKINDTNEVEMWNNTVTNNGRNLSIVQDTRRASDSSVPGHDDRRKSDPSMTWILDDIVVSNNVLWLDG